MKYTNGFDSDLVVPALYQRLGWMQPTLANSPTLNAANLLSNSGRFFNDGSFHALCTINNIKQNQEDDGLNDSGFNALLATVQKSLILRSLNEVFREPELIEQTLMYTRFGFNDIPITNSTDFLGYVINIANDKSISTKINFATFYFTQDCTFPVSLYQDGVKDPLLTFNVTVQAWQRTLWELDGSDSDHPEIVLKFVKGRRYYLGYFQSDLGSAQAIQEQIDVWATTYCFEAYPLRAPADSFFGFNHNYRQFPFLPGGINLEVIAFRDHTEKIIRKANLFDELQGLQMAVYTVELVNNSTRTNFTQRNTEQQSQQMYADLNQAFATKEIPITPGLKSRVFAEFKRIRETFFPKQKAVSLPMQVGSVQDQLDRSWYLQNYRQLTNPPAQVVPSGGGA